MQQILNVLVPATSYDLLSLDEMKLKLGIPEANTTNDALIQEIITNVSDTVARLCNRVFGYEQVEETFYQLEDDRSQRLYLTRWPVVLSDIQSITQDGSDILVNGSGLPPLNWVLEEATGTLYRRTSVGPWYGVIDVVYGGGYELPDEAPSMLKLAAEAVVRESYSAFIRNPSLYGVRLLSHKASRIGYYAPTMLPTLGSPATWTTVKAMLAKFIRHWV